MSAAVTGLLHGSVIELDEPMPGLEGRRVRVTVEADEATATPEAWDAWVKSVPQGPIEDDDDAGFP
jgi:hypothetical protein